MVSLRKLAAREPEESANLIARAKTGDGDAFGRLILFHQNNLQQFVARKVRSREDVADLCQDVLLKAYTKLDRFQGRSSFRTWLLSIARRAIADYYRMRIDPGIFDRDSVVNGHAKKASPRTRRNPIREAWEARRLIEHCLGCIIRTLSLEQQLAIILCDIYGFNDKETSRLTGKTLGAFKHMLHDAREIMKHVSQDKCALVGKTGDVSGCKLQSRRSSSSVHDTVKQDSHAPLLSLRTDLLDEIQLSLEAVTKSSRSSAEKICVTSGKEKRARERRRQ